MKKILIVLYIFFPIICLYSQSRVNAELATVIDTGKEITDTLGWSKNDAGQWGSRKNLIFGHWTYFDNGFSSFDKIKRYNVSYKGDEYVLLEIIVKDYGYKYPSLREGIFYYRSSHFYLIESSYFNVTLIKNEKCSNHIQIDSYREDRTVDTFYYLPEKYISEKITPYINKPYPGKIPAIIDDDGKSYLELNVFYYSDENVIRFYFGNNTNKIVLEDFYFECDFNHFVDFFEPIIKE